MTRSMLENLKRMPFQSWFFVLVFRIQFLNKILSICVFITFSPEVYGDWPCKFKRCVLLHQCGSVSRWGLTCKNVISMVRASEYVLARQPRVTKLTSALWEGREIWSNWCVNQIKYVTYLSSWNGISSCGEKLRSIPKCIDHQYLVV